MRESLGRAEGHKGHMQEQEQGTHTHTALEKRNLHHSLIRTMIPLTALSRSTEPDVPDKSALVFHFPGPCLHTPGTESVFGVGGLGDRNDLGQTANLE